MTVYFFSHRLKLCANLNIPRISIFKTTMQTPTSVRKEWGRSTETVIPLQPVVRWQAKPLCQRSVVEENPACSQPVKDPMLEQEMDTEAGCDSEGSPHWTCL